MIYTELTKKALNICYKAHAGQRDKGEMPYVFHPFHLAEQMDDEESTIVALLHDVVEDAGKRYSFDDFREEGFSDAVVDALELLTHKEEEPYMDYIRRVKENPLAAKVKMADLEHNSDKSRLDHDPTAEDKARLEKYAKATAILRGERQ